jgi:hypothetical protein
MNNDAQNTCIVFILHISYQYLLPALAGRYKVIEKEQIFLPLEEFENLEFDIFIFFW